MHRFLYNFIVLLALLCTTVKADQFVLGDAFDGGWFDPEQPGQGLMVDASSGGDFFFGGWFTYPMPGEPAPGAHRWWTIEGHYEGPQSELLIYLTTGGEFVSDDTVASEIVGSANIALVDCNTLALSYQFDSGESGTVVMTRLLDVNDSHCDSVRLLSHPDFVIPASAPVLFRNVSLVSMSEEQPLVTDGTTNVLVADGVVEGIGALSELNLPPDMVMIDGQGRHLMPGLIDTHTHLAVNISELQGFAAPQTLEHVATNQLQLYLANGVTTILNLGDFGEPQPRWAREIQAGTRIGPTLLAAKYARGDQDSCDGGPPAVTVGNSAQAGRNYVQQAAAEGFHFIKIYNCTPPAAVEGILEQAALTGMTVAGHFPIGVNTEDLIEHPVFTLVAHSSAFLWNGYLSPQSGPGARNQAIARMRDSDTALSSTLRIVEILNRIWCHNQAGFDEWRATAPLEYMHHTELQLHERSFGSGRFAPPGCTPASFTGDLLFARDMVKKMRAGGGLLVTGTDSPTVFGVAGFSMHDELLALSRAGLTVPETLAAATRNPGAYINRHIPGETPVGKIEPGYQADLLLLDRDPESAMIQFHASIEMVMARGHVYPRAVRQAWLDRIRADYGN